MIKLYTFHLSTNGRKVHMALEEAKAAYEIVAVNLMQGEQKNPDYLKLNPNGKVPTLVDDGLVMWESVAILLYLAEKFPAANLLPSAPAARAPSSGWCGSLPPLARPSAPSFASCALRLKANAIRR